MREALSDLRDALIIPIIAALVWFAAIATGHAETTGPVQPSVLAGWMIAAAWLGGVALVLMFFRGVKIANRDSK